MPNKNSSTRRKPDTGSATFDKQKQRWVARSSANKLVKPEKRIFKTREEADAWLDQRIKDRADGILVEGVPTVAEWLTYWHTYICEVKVTTHEDYGDVIRIRIVPYLGNIPLNELTIEQVEQWLKRLKDKYKFYSIRNTFRLLRQALRAAVTRDKVRKNVTDGIKLRAPDEIEEEKGIALEFERVNKLLVAVVLHRLYALYVLAVTTGMRQAELIGLRWPRVEVDKKPYRISVREQIRPVNGKRTRLPPKSKRSKRDIPIDDQLAAILREHRDRWREEKARLMRENPAWKTTDLVFLSEAGTPLSHENLRRHFYAALAKADLGKVRFHDLRHTAGSLMLNQGINIIAISEILGHSSVTVTAEVYAHSFADQKGEAIAAITNNLKLATGDLQQ